MQAIKYYLIAALVVTFLAGLATGVVMTPWRSAAPDERRHERRGGGPVGEIMERLDLSEEQRKQVREIWSRAFENAPRAPMDKFRELDQQRDAAVDALLSPEQREKVAKIESDCQQKKNELNAPAMEAFRRAREETRAILTPEQQPKFDEFMDEQMRRWRGGRGRGGPPPEAPPPTP